MADGPRDPVTGKRNLIKRRGKSKKEAKKRIEDAIRALEENGLSEREHKKIIFSQVANE
ncbi:hypothetical protein [Alkalihalobacillus trypoxylicola]|uniref:hypothetical protein n=1 Tax=Alkalihalobacillus trypoxylicola TaxID=519424 RepID=UPI000A6D6E5D|nr:hypothetical protein [Alkalihalobacillus trypoxylicola]